MNASRQLSKLNWKLYLMLVFTTFLVNSCKKDVDTASPFDVPDLLKQVMTQQQQVCVYTYWVTEEWEGDNLVSRSRDLVGVACSTGGGGSTGGGTSGGTATVVVDIKPDSLKKQYPCVYDLLTTLTSYPELDQFLGPFIAQGPDGVNPNLTWRTDPNLPWNTVGETIFGTTQVDPKEAVSSIISLNTKMLDQSAPVLISSIMVHEMLHAYFNTITAFSRYGIVADDAKPVLERLSNFAKVSSDINGRDHLTILSEYISTIAAVESESDGAKRSKEDYYKIAIGTLYNDGKIPSSDFISTYNTLLASINSANNFSITKDNATQLITALKKVPIPNRVKCLL